MPLLKKNKSRAKRDKNYDKIEVSDLPKDLLKSMREITLAEDDDLVSLVNSSIAGREVTNEIDHLREWCENCLAKNTVIVASTDEEYYDIVYSALLSLPNQYSKGLAQQDRGPIDMLAKKVGGYLVEFAVQMWAKKIGVELQLAHEIGDTAHFLHSDFPSVFDNGNCRKARINVGAKCILKNAVWADVPASQFSNTDFQIFGRSTTDGKHLDKDALLSLMTHNPYLSARKYPKYLSDYIENLRRKPISVYLFGFAKKPEDAGFSYRGWRGNSIFHITEMSGTLPENYKDIVRKRSGLPKKFKVKFLCIEEFKRHDEGSLCVWNSGSIMKTNEQIDELIRKL